MRPLSIAATAEPVSLPRLQARRLREIHRSAGWPAFDAVEIDLLAAGLVERVFCPAGRETLRLTAAGIEGLARSLQRNRAAFGLHEALVERVVLEMQRAGRIAWRGLSLRARVDEAWVMAMPDVYSVRHTTVEAYLAPVVHEIKVRRADLLADLRRPAKRAAYLQMAGACSYVIAEGIAEADEIPPECGVILARRRADGAGFGALECLRPAPLRAMSLPFAAWMALARATPAASLDEAQDGLADAGGEPAADAVQARAGVPAEPEVAKGGRGRGQDADCIGDAPTDASARPCGPAALPPSHGTGLQGAPGNAPGP